MLQPVIKDEQAILDRARKAQSLREVGEIAAHMLQTYFPNGAGLVVRPITSGGVIRADKPSRQGNLEALRRDIERLKKGNEADVPIVDQLLFKSFIDKHRIKWRESDKTHATGYYDAIKYDFYGPMLATGLIVALFLHEDWKKSQTCRFVRKEVLDRQGKILKLE